MTASAVPISPSNTADANFGTRGNSSTARTQPLNAAGPIGALPATSGRQAALNRLTGNAPALKQSVIQHAFIPQAAKGLAAALKQGEGTITINLKPAHLGSLKVEVTMQGTEVAARLEASSETARQLLIDAQPSLRAALEARGLSVERIDITVAPHGAPSQDAADQKPNLDQHAKHESGQPGQHTGSGAEAHTGGGRGHERRGGDIEFDADTAPPIEVSFTLEQGGVYRLHLDAVA